MENKNRHPRRPALAAAFIDQTTLDIVVIASPHTGTEPLMNNSTVGGRIAETWVRPTCPDFPVTSNPEVESMEAIS